MGNVRNDRQIALNFCFVTYVTLQNGWGLMWNARNGTNKESFDYVTYVTVKKQWLVVHLFMFYLRRLDEAVVVHQNGFARGGVNGLDEACHGIDQYSWFVLISKATPTFARAHAPPLEWHLSIKKGEPIKI